MTARRAVLLALVLVAAAPAAAQAKTRNVTVTGDLVISTANDPANTGKCSVIVFYEWSDVPKTTSATVNYTTSDGKQKSASKAAPFDDSLPREKPPRIAPPGRHRLVVGFSYGASPTKPNPNCRNSTEPKYRQSLPPTAPVTLTVEGDSPACTTARKTLAKRSKTERKIKRKLRKTSRRSAKRALRRKLARAKKSRKRAAKAVTKLC